MADAQRADVCGYRTLIVRNDEGEKYHVAHESCKSIVSCAVTSPTQYQKLNELADLGVKEFRRFDFLTRPYSDGEIQRVVSSCVESTAISKTHNANFRRELL